MGHINPSFFRLSLFSAQSKYTFPKFFLVIAVLCGSFNVLADELSIIEKKLSTCFSCHGDKGINRSAHYPILAAQQSTYLVKQLNAFNSGERINLTMQAQSRHLSTEEINNFGAYFAAQKAIKLKVDAELASKGKTKSVKCLGCHGAAGEGLEENPRLAGQHPAYLETQLLNFKYGNRKNDAMQSITGNLSDEDIKAIAEYLGGL